jgi:hypothetical protein
MAPSWTIGVTMLRVTACDLTLNWLKPRNKLGKSATAMEMCKPVQFLQDRDKGSSIATNRQEWFR